MTKREEDTMKRDKVYLTFSTDIETSEILKELAHFHGMTQPELIEVLCKNHIKRTMKIMQEAIEKEKQNRLE